MLARERSDQNRKKSSCCSGSQFLQFANLWDVLCCGTTPLQITRLEIQQQPWLPPEASQIKVALSCIEADTLCVGATSLSSVSIYAAEASPHFPISVPKLTHPAVQVRSNPWKITCWKWNSLRISRLYDKQWSLFMPPPAKNAKICDHAVVKQKEDSKCSPMNVCLDDYNNCIDFSNS